MRARAIALVALIDALVGSAASADDPWDQFLRDPDADSFGELSTHVDGSQCDWGKAANEAVAPDRIRGPLFRLIAAGNERAFVIGLSAIRCFDGGDLEDFYESAGLFLEQHPREFLLDVTERHVAQSDVAHMAASVPTNDDIDAALDKVGNRIAVLRRVDDVKAARARAESVRALREHEQSLRQFESSLVEGK